MSNYILLNRIQVQNANAIAGFTWGFPAITHFLGFAHNLTRKLLNSDNFKDIVLEGCAVVAHKQQVHTYKPFDYQFTQNRNPPYLKSHDKTATPPVIEEGKMNMTVSLVIGYKGNLGNRQDDFLKWLKNACMMQRLAGGTILKISDIDIFSPDKLRTIRRKLLPGFVLLDRSAYLETHYKELQHENPDTELLDTWLDFIALKQKARPKSNLISKHISRLIENEPENEYCQQLMDNWDAHLALPYDDENRSLEELNIYFAQLEPNKNNKKLLEQWQSYCAPTDKTEADWEYVAKPEAGYLVPIMTGYKAISEVFQNAEVENSRDHETPVCFVESVHSIGEWRSVHRLKTAEDFSNCLWHYHFEENWYLCRQNQTTSEQNKDSLHVMIYEDPEDDFS
jgi:CRISPR-associated protein Csy2